MHCCWSGWWLTKLPRSRHAAEGPYFVNLVDVAAIFASKTMRDVSGDSKADIGTNAVSSSNRSLYLGQVLSALVHDSQAEDSTDDVHVMPCHDKTTTAETSQDNLNNSGLFPKSDVIPTFSPHDIYERVGMLMAHPHERNPQRNGEYENDCRRA